MDQLRFTTDENIHPDISVYLCTPGHDSMTVWDQSLRGTTDSNLAKVCKLEGRVLITCDSDFCDIRTYPPSKYSGLIVLRTTSQSRQVILEAIDRVIVTIEKYDIKHMLWIVEDSRIRIRSGH